MIDQVAEPVRVLFLCTQNSARSQMAEALLARKSGGRFMVASAGTDPAGGVHPLALGAIKRAGIEWDHARPRAIAEVIDGRTWDVVITLCDRARETCPTLPEGTVTAHWSVPDPAAHPNEHDADVFWEVFAMISRRIDLLCALPHEKVRGLGARETLQQLHNAESAKERTT